MNSKDIAGWFSENDIKSYQHLIAQIPCSGTLVEVGSYLGRSLASVESIAHMRKISLIAVDVWDDTKEDFERMGFAIPHMKTFVKNVPSAYPLKMDSLSGAKKLLSIHGRNYLDAVFLDADHSYEAVRADIDAWLPLIKKGGWIGGHDYCWGWRGVKKAVKEAFGKDYKTLSDTIWYHYV